MCVGDENNQDDVYVGDGYADEPKTVFEAALKREPLDSVRSQSGMRRLDMHACER